MTKVYTYVLRWRALNDDTRLVIIIAPTILDAKIKGEMFSVPQSAWDEVTVLGEHMPALSLIL